jgi:hypothetical protein
MGSEDAPESKGPADEAGADARERVAPGLADAFRELRDTGRSTWSAGREAVTAFRILFTADISLARSALGRSVAFTAVAIIFGASAWLLLMAALIAWLSLTVGWAWWLSLLLTGTASLIAMGVAGWLAMHYFEHTRLQATRRQLARLGIGELSGLMPAADSAKSAKDGAEQVAQATEEGVKKGLGVDVTPP